MWVEPEARGQGLARQLLRRVEVEALREGVSILRLETGVDSREGAFIPRPDSASSRPSVHIIPIRLASSWRRHSPSSASVRQGQGV